MTPTPHLDAETIAAYIDHRLSLAERHRAEVHLADCRDCLGVMAGSVRTVDQLVADGVVTTDDDDERAG